MFLCLPLDYTCCAQQTLTVPDDYPVIQAAIDAAQPGDTVYIKAGTYQQSLIIDKALRLIGSSRNEVRIGVDDPERPVVLVVLDEGNVELKGFSVSGGACGILANTLTQGSVDMSDMLIVENEIGVRTLGGGSVVVDQCLLVDNNVGLFIAGLQTEIVDSEVDLGTVGVLLASSGRVTMSRCLIGFAQIGISTYTIWCRWKSGSEVYSGRVSGDANRIFGTLADLCPEDSERFWPEMFADEVWGEAVVEIMTAYREGEDAYENQDYHGAYLASSRALSLLESGDVSFPLLKSAVLQSIGVIQWNLDQDEDAVESLERARAIYSDRQMEVEMAEIDASIVTICANLGTTYYSLLEYQRAIDYYERALTSFVGIGDRAGEATSLNNLGNCYRSLSEYQRAIDYYEQALTIFVDIDACAGEAAILGNLGNCYESLLEYQRAIDYYEQALAIFADTGDRTGEATCLNNLGLCHESLSEYAQAIDYFEQSFAIFVDIDDRGG